MGLRIILAVDEPKAVGEKDEFGKPLPLAERMQRATDIEGNRQFKDFMYNSATSKEFKEIPISDANPSARCCGLLSKQARGTA